MEDWIKVIKEKMLAYHVDLPEEDWNWFETNYSNIQRRRRMHLWLIASTSIAAAVVVLFILQPSRENSRDDSIAEGSFKTAPSKEETLQLSYPVQPMRETQQTHKDYVLSRDQSTFPTDTISIIEAESGLIEPEIADKSRIGNIASFESENAFFEALKQIDGKHRARRRFSFSSSTSGFFNERTRQHSYSAFKDLDGLSGVPPGFWDESFIESGIGEFDQKVRAHHQIPLSMEFDASTFLAPDMALTTGLSLSFYQSRFMNESMMESKTTYQRAYYLGIPLRLDWMVWEQDRFCAWLGVGGKADYLVYGKLDNQQLTDQSVHWSVLGNIGIQYKLTPTIGLFFQPEISYYFRPSNPALLTYRTDHPIAFVLGAGLRWTIALP